MQHDATGCRWMQTAFWDQAKLLALTPGEDAPVSLASQWKAMSLSFSRAAFFQCWLLSVRRLLWPHWAQCTRGTVFKPPPPLGTGRCQKSQQRGHGTFQKHSRGFLALHPLLELGLLGAWIAQAPQFSSLELFITLYLSKLYPSLPSPSI